MAELILTSNTTFEAVDLINGALSGVTNFWAGSSGIDSLIRNNSSGNLAGNFAYAEGSGTTAGGDYSYAQGSLTVASGDYSHAEGRATTASGLYSHAGGSGSTATGSSGFSFGKNNLSEGRLTAVLGGLNNGITGESISNVIFVGQDNKIFQKTNSIIDGSFIAGGDDNIINCTASDSGEFSTIIGGVGNKVTATGPSSSLLSTIIGGNDNTIKDSSASSILGGPTGSTLGNLISSANTSSIIGATNSEINNTIYSQIIGGAENRIVISNSNLNNVGHSSVILGGLTNEITSAGSGPEDFYNNVIIGGEDCEMEGGQNNVFIGVHFGATQGVLSTSESGKNSVLIGGFGNEVRSDDGDDGNVILGGKFNFIDGLTNCISMGNGTQARSAHTITMGYNAGPGHGFVNNTIAFNMEEGYGIFEGSANAGPADYAEYFEWNDGNNLDEDRVGNFVSLVGKKIEIGNYNVIGIISAQSTVVADAAPLKWHDLYLKDDFGRKLYDTYQVYEINSGQTKIFIDKNNNIYSRPPSLTNMVGDLYEEAVDEKTFIESKNVPIVNPSFDKNQNYTSRKTRKEWATVGLLGKLDVRTSEQITGTKVDVDANGMAINGTDYHVLEKTKDYDGSYGIVRVLFK